MKRALINTMVAGLTMALWRQPALAQQPNVTLHVNTKWKSCAIQLDPSLTQQAWHQFTQELGIVAYYRPLTDARPLGAKRFEVSVMQWQTRVDETSDAWNNTFVHPDSTHWLTEGGPLAIPGLMFRAGVTDRIDVGGYFTKNIRSNYGLWGGQVQYAVINDPRRQFAASTRLSVVSLYGPADVNATVYGLDLLASKTVSLARRISIAPYGGVSTVFSNSHEKSALVNLADEHTVGVMGTVGAVARLSVATLAVQYDLAQVRSLSFKVGVGF